MGNCKQTKNKRTKKHTFRIVRGSDITKFVHEDDFVFTLFAVGMRRNGHFILTRFESYTGIDRVALRKLLNYAVLIVICPCFLN